MAANVETIRQLAKSIIGCILLSLCSFCSRTWEERHINFTDNQKTQSGNISDSASEGERDDKSSDVTSTVRWASMVLLLSAIYYIKIQLWKKLWQRKQERGQRVLRRNQYRQTRTGQMQASSHISGNSRHSFDVGEEDIDLDSLPPISENEDVIEVAAVVSNDVYYPELTMSSVWTYVYGYGILLFVCTYCLAGINIPSSCWWVMGMTALCFDELISRGVNKWFICVILLNVCVSVFSVWSAALMDNEGNLIGELMFSKTNSLPLFDFVMGVVLPVSTPFIFFSVRSTVRSATRDVYKLCEFALPFMTVLAICILVATSGICHVMDDKSTSSSNQYSNYDSSISTGFKPHGARQANSVERLIAEIDSSKRRSQTKNVHHQSHNGLNGSYYGTSSAPHTETSARFSEERPITLSVQYFKFSTDSNALRYTLLFLSPFIAFWIIHILITSIHTGHVTEFIASFILVNSTRYAITHQVSSLSMLSMSGAGLAFAMLIMGKKD